ncbi:MAG: shikimate kinase [Spirochaetia bacterium]
MKHTGKSRVARLVASRMNRDLIDIDEKIEQMYAAQSGERLVARDIYRHDDGQIFRQLETAACSRAARSPKPVVVATGGGVCDNSEAIAELRSGMIVALEADPELLFNRIIRNGIPAFMTASTPAEAKGEFADLHRRRSVLYRAISNVVVEVGGRQPAEVAAEVILRIEEYVHGGK